MNTIFTIDEPENYIDKINLDELYEKNDNMILLLLIIIKQF